jgi:hypothetical protein
MGFSLNPSLQQIFCYQPASSEIGNAFVSILMGALSDSLLASNRHAIPIEWNWSISTTPPLEKKRSMSARDETQVFLVSFSLAASS